jgi:hypothetical protein
MAHGLQRTAGGFNGQWALENDKGLTAIGGFNGQQALENDRGLTAFGEEGSQVALEDDMGLTASLEERSVGEPKGNKKNDWWAEGAMDRVH